MQRRTLLFALVATGLGGCVGDELVTYTPETPAERELRESRERLQRTVGEGGVFGAGVGAAAGAAAGGLQGAFRGAQVGRLGGAAAGAYVRQLQERYASREAILGQVVTDLRATNTRMEQSIAAMKAAQAERRAAGPDATRDRRIAEEAVASVQAAEQQVQFFAQTRSILDEQGLSASGSAVDPELARLRQRVSTMRSIAAALAPTG